MDVSRLEYINVGDPHNFGKCVSLNDEWVIKPRCVAWEWLFLSGNSPLRQCVRQISKQNDEISPDSGLVDLNYVTVDGGEFSEGGRVERISAVIPTAHTISASSVNKIGMTLGMLMGFGIGDLHRNNILFGAGQNSGFVFSPLDIECVFNRFDLISQSLLLPSRELMASDCGLNDLQVFAREYSNINFPAMICEGYAYSASFVYNHHQVINHVLSKIPKIYEWPIRVIVRNTREYYAVLNGSVSADNLAQPLLKCESEQLSRHDIPYFFTNLSSGRVFYFQTHNGSAVADLSAQMMKKNLVVPRTGDFLFGKNDSDVMQNGLLQLARYFDFGYDEYVSEYEKFKITYAKSDLYIESGKLKLRCKRNGRR